MEKIQEAIEKLKLEPKRDNEGVHVAYDDVLEAIAEHYAPDKLAEIKELVKDIDFWYA